MAQSSRMIWNVSAAHPHRQQRLIIVTDCFLKVAIPTYFMIGTRPLPESIQARLLAGPELVKNLVCLGKLYKSFILWVVRVLIADLIRMRIISGKTGTIESDGISIGFLGGVPTDDVDAVSGDIIGAHVC